jgi:hypothetical protein
MHGTWGAFWIGYGVLWGFAAAGAYTLPGVRFPELGLWFVALAAITFAGAAVAFFEGTLRRPVLPVGKRAQGSHRPARWHSTRSSTPWACRACASASRERATRASPP